MAKKTATKKTSKPRIKTIRSTPDVTTEPDDTTAQDASEEMGEDRAAAVLEVVEQAEADGFSFLTSESDPGDAPVDASDTPTEMPQIATIASDDQELRDEVEEAIDSNDALTIAGTLGTIIGKRDELEAEKAAAVKAYGKRINTLDGRISELGEKLRGLTTEVVIDHDQGIAIYKDKRTGRVTMTRPLAASERQLDLPLGHPSKPPVAGPVVGLCCEGVDGVCYMVEEVKEGRVTLLMVDGSRRLVPLEQWSEFAPKDGIDPQEYDDGFGEGWAAAHDGGDPPGTYTDVAGNTRLVLDDAEETSS